jgi:hypothetical protein
LHRAAVFIVRVNLCPNECVPLRHREHLWILKCMVYEAFLRLMCVDTTLAKGENSFHTVAVSGKYSCNAPSTEREFLSYYDPTVWLVLASVSISLRFFDANFSTPIRAL